MDNNTIIYIIIGVIILLSILTIFLFSRYRKYKKNFNNLLPLTNQMNFNEDIKPLMYFIDFKCKMAEKVIIETRKNSKKTILNDKYYNETIENITMEVMDGINENYIIMLYTKYFNEEGLKVFIVQNIVNRISTLINEINKNSLKQMNNDELDFIK